MARFIWLIDVTTNRDKGGMLFVAGLLVGTLIGLGALGLIQRL